MLLSSLVREGESLCLLPRRSPVALALQAESVPESLEALCPSLAGLHLDCLTVSRKSRRKELLLPFARGGN